jgi:hypothetical protein
MSTHKQFTGPQVEKVKQLSGLDDSIREFYNTFMETIEPDLTIANMQTLDTKYANETEKEREERAMRYNHAYELFQAAFTYFIGQWQSDLEYYRQLAAAAAKQQADAEDKARLNDITQSLQ